MFPDLSLIIPCYNEEENIAKIYQEIYQLNLEEINLEVLFVNNGSIDSTEIEIQKVITKNIKKNLNIKLVNLKKNLNYDGGIYNGLKNANGKYLSWTHGDLQTPIEDVIKLYNKLKNKNKVFGKGVRKNNRGYDSIISKFHEKLCSLVLGYNMREINAQPKIFEKKFFHLFSNPPIKYTKIDTYFYYTSLRNNFEIEELDVIFKSRIHGVSKWKNNFLTFITHILMNFLYLFQLKLFKK